MAEAAALAALIFLFFEVFLGEERIDEEERECVRERKGQGVFYEFPRASRKVKNRKPSSLRFRSLEGKKSEEKKVTKKNLHLSAAVDTNVEKLPL